MKRRDFLSKAGLGVTAGVIGASTLSTPAISGGHKTINVVSTWPRDFPGLGLSAQRLSARITELSEGKLKVNYFAAGEKVGAFDVFDEVASGNSQAYIAAEYYWKGKHAAFNYFTSVPFGMTTVEWNAWIKFGGGQKLWDDLSGEFGLKALPCGGTGTQAGGWFNKEITSGEDLKGLKMRIPGFGGKVLSKAGGAAVTVAGGEIYTNLERGVIDATEWIGPYHDYLMGFYQVAKYYYYPGWHEPGGVLEMIVNKDKFSELPSDLQEIIKKGIESLNIWMQCEFDSKNSIYLNKHLNEENVQLRQFPKDVLDTFKSKTEEVIQEMIETDSKSKKIFEAYDKFRLSFKDWSTVSDRIYYEL